MSNHLALRFKCTYKPGERFTDRNYVSSISSRLNVNKRAEAAAYAVEHNLKE